jgi:hypothetical protein
MPKLSILVEWEDTVHQTLALTRNFPKSVRFTFSQRIDNLVLDVAETLIAIQYTPRSEQVVLMEKLQQYLARLRLLLRLSADEGYLSFGNLKKSILQIDQLGSRLAAWKQKL